MPVKQERAIERQERILDAALDVFAGRGYQAATVDDVASAARTSKGGVYFHFPGKDAIFIALLDRSAGLLLSRLRDRVAAEADPIAKVDAALRELIQTFGAHRTLARLFLVEALGAGPRFHTQMVQVHLRFVAFLQAQLDDAVSQGLIRPLDTRVASLAWFGALNQIVTSWVLSERPGRLEDAYPALRTLLLQSVGLLGRRLMQADFIADRPSPFRIWLLAARVPTLPAAIVPVLVGSATAWREGFFLAGPFVAALLASILIQIGTNLANDYFDFRKGADTAGRLGPVRVTQSGLVPPETVRLAAMLTFGLAALLGVYLVAVGGLPILAIGVLSIAAGVVYTGGPWPLAYHGLGDVTVFIFFGLVAVIGTAYLHAGALLPLSEVTALPVAALVTAILVVNNLRDIDTDRATNKHTLAVRLGRRATRLEYLLLLIVAYAVPLASWLMLGVPRFFWLPWLSLPLAVNLLRLVFTVEGRPLNAALAGTGRLHLVFGVLFAASIAL